MRLSRLSRPSEYSRQELLGSLLAGRAEELFGGADFHGLYRLTALKQFEPRIQEMALWTFRNTCNICQ